MRILYFLLLMVLADTASAQQLPTVFEQSGGKKTPTYEEAIAWWKKMDAASPYVSMKEMGATDAGYPLHLVLVSADRDFDMASARKKKKVIILFNNGIHPGEPDGIDASMLLVKQLVLPALNKKLLPANVVLAFIPVYNIGGALNRSANYRVDQNGPEEFGFRGNSQNLDLNRDFIKCDSKDAFAFTGIFQYLDPDVFVDNHVSNGADYQHVMTLIASQHNHLGGAMGEFLNKQFEPGLYDLMKAKGYDLVPYVNHFGDTPDKGWSEFWDSPRYSSGYASLWNTFSFIPETHMLKPYAQRVDATVQLMKSFIEFSSAHAAEMLQLRSETVKRQQDQESFPLAWKLNQSQWKDIVFKGFESGYKTSEVSGMPRLYYDRSKPFSKTIPFYNYYVDTLSVSKPTAYIIPQGWWKVVERLKANGVKMRRLSRDTSLDVEVYHIDSYQSGNRPFEGHHVNANVTVSKTTQRMTFRKGDYFIPLNQRANRFLMETLEPQGEDSYFAWNFFDPILGQKEGISEYVFEETAVDYLNSHPEVKQKLETRRSADSSFAKNGRAQLNFVYQNSPYFEPDYLRYPVYRVMR